MQLNHNVDLIKYQAHPEQSCQKLVERANGLAFSCGRGAAREYLKIATISRAEGGQLQRRVRPYRHLSQYNWCEALFS
jgi:hypothetical protein